MRKLRYLLLPLLVVPSVSYGVVSCSAKSSSSKITSNSQIYISKCKFNDNKMITIQLSHSLILPLDENDIRVRVGLGNYNSTFLKIDNIEGLNQGSNTITIKLAEQAKENTLYVVDIDNINGGQSSARIHFGNANPNEGIEIKNATSSSDGNVIYVNFTKPLKQILDIKSVHLICNPNKEINIKDILFNELDSRKIELHLANPIDSQHSYSLFIDSLFSSEIVDVINKVKPLNIDIKIKSAIVSSDGKSLTINLSNKLSNDLQSVNSISDGSYKFNDAQGYISMESSSGDKANSDVIKIIFSDTVKKGDSCQVGIRGINGAEGYEPPVMVDCINNSEVTD